LKRFSEVNLVLSGGAAKGIAHIGVLKALEEIGIKVKSQIIKMWINVKIVNIQMEI